MVAKNIYFHFMSPTELAPFQFRSSLSVITHSSFEFVRWTGGNGVFIGMLDFHVDTLTGRVALSIGHADRTAVFGHSGSTTCDTMPTVSLSVTNFQLKLRADGLSLKGERGTKVPDMKVS